MRAITKNTRRVTALTLAAALVVAVYLNWQYARTGIGVDEEAVNVSAVAVEGEPVAHRLRKRCDLIFMLININAFHCHAKFLQYFFHFVQHI